MLIHQEVRELLGEFRLEGMQTHLDRTLEAAGQEKSDPLVVVRNLLRQEKSSRQERKKRLLLKMSGLPYRKTLADFDFSFQPSIEERKVRELHTLHFLAQGENVLLLGPPGVGKSHIAIALALEAIEHFQKVQYVTATPGGAVAYRLPEWELPGEDALLPGGRPFVDR
ncbi:MAG TPA: ATP-binding protein [Atribacteraceae bacterium]|nr:ATP-binding protein [Atribacteraceae bacterium]